ncbi:MAG: hypothetical protein CMF43_01990 [Legionellales bacterium]|nr:hypothetical protein [Legionellales bacterium]|tara:strand:- start:1470 stop:1691 length:222 start_codon:yes stop_codon:yes gene_type:complete
MCTPYITTIQTQKNKTDFTKVKPENKENVEKTISKFTQQAEYDQESYYLINLEEDTPALLAYTDGTDFYVRQP